MCIEKSCKQHSRTTTKPNTMRSRCEKCQAKLHQKKLKAKMHNIHKHVTYHTTAYYASMPNKIISFDGMRKLIFYLSMTKTVTDTARVKDAILHCSISKGAHSPYIGFQPTGGLSTEVCNTRPEWLATYSYLQWCIAKNGGGYTQRGVEKGLKVPCLFMITEVSICCQKNPEVGIRRIPPNTPLVTCPSIQRRCPPSSTKLYSLVKTEDTAHSTEAVNQLQPNKNTLPHSV